ncbi:MAG: xanthine dehydrogenase family protein molybdopterin-binding subunit [Deltaproteobacteria bacterium]|nr:xanthine dehydrogenase family protein molybdopterin-binding subunit [Deltaproteobacteria bacterium]
MTRYLGKACTRPDAAGKAMGRAEYIHDLSRPRMLHGAIRFSDHAHARIKHVDTSRAAQIPGVRAVITAQNTPEVRLGYLRDNVALKGGKVRQFRDEIAAVAATDPHIAAAAAAAIDVEYEPLPAVFDPIAALAEGAPLIHDRDSRGKPVATNLLPVHFRHSSGDVAAARASSAHVISGEFSTPLIQQTCMGTAGAIAEFDPQMNLTMWAKTQIPFLAQRDFNGALQQMGLVGKNTRVIVPAMGGGFGTGLDTHCYEYIAILLAWRTGLPVKILYNRDQEFAFLSPRQSCTVRISQGCDAEGRLTFRHVHVIQDNGAYASWGATYPGVMLIPATSLYRVPNVHFDCELVYTNNTYAQAMRGYGNPELTWALECNLDELAEAAGIDSLDMRRINCNEPDEVTPMGLKVTTCGLRDCLDGTARRLDWKGKRGAGKSRGVGMASLMHVGGSGRIYRSDASGVILRLDDYGNLYVSSGGVEMGQGHHSALQIIAADSVGLRPERIFITPTDTSTCPWDLGTHASRGAFTAGNALLLAAAKLRDKLFDAAVELYPPLVERALRSWMQENPDTAPTDFDWRSAVARDRFELRDDVLFLRDTPDLPWLAVDVAKLIRAAHFREGGGEMFTVEAFYDPPSELPDWERGVGNMSACYAFGTQGVEVEVDTGTGDVRILKFVVILDVGRVINPQALRGQVMGALAQGVGYALYEQVITDEGRVLNANFTDYKIPTAVEMDFPVELDFLETNEPTGPYGAKGIGEPGLTPTAPAIANAIYDAVGVRVRDLPITPEKLLAALHDKNINASPDGGRDDR